MRVAQVIGKLAVAGVESVVNNYYCKIDTHRVQFDYIIDDNSACPPSQQMIHNGARYFVVPSSKHPVARMAALIRLFKKNKLTIGNEMRDWKQALAVFFEHWNGDNGMKCD